jgi:transposase-like protein
LDKVKKDQTAVKLMLHRIMNATGLVKARQAAGRFVERWYELYPKAVEYLRKDIAELLTFFSFKTPSWWKSVRTANSIERRFREVRRRTRPMGVFSDRTSMERILYAVFSCENKQQRINTPFLMTQNS